MLVFLFVLTHLQRLDIAIQLSCFQSATSILEVFVRLTYVRNSLRLTEFIQIIPVQ